MLPSEADFHARGIVDVEFDLPPGETSGQPERFGPNADWLSGWGRFNPTPEYPTILTRPPGTVIRWTFCPQGNSTSALCFRRQAQVKALDTLPHTTRSPNIARSSSTLPRSSSSSPSLGDSQSPPHRRYRPPSRILAWWEDSLGYWLVVDGKPMRYRPIADAWADVLGPGWPHDGSLLEVSEVDAINTSDTSLTTLGTSPDRCLKTSSRWADACDLLAKIVVCLQALHDRHMSLNWCHPSCFMMLDDSVVAHRLWHATAMPGLSLMSLLTPELASSSLFTRDPIHHSSYNLSEGYAVRHLRYLAPEAAISRRVGPSNDIYGWGVLAYELLTGKTIDGSPDSPGHRDIDLLADVHFHVTNEVMPPIDYLERLARQSSNTTDLPPRQLSQIIMLALAKDPEDRYHSLDPLVYDLRKLSQICRANGDLSKFEVGAVDRASRFRLPPQVIERGAEMEALNNAFRVVVNGTLSSRVATVWGQSGSGKTRLVTEWVNALESSSDTNRCLVGLAQADEHVKKPFASFVQIIQSLLDRVLTDAREDSNGWLKRIRAALGSNWNFFASFLSPYSRRLINEELHSHPAIGTEKFLVTFRSWSRRLLQLFATQHRPLVLVLDNVQWMAPDEIDIWRDILDGAFPLNYVVAVCLIRTQGSDPPSSKNLLAKSTMRVPIPRLTEEGVGQFINTCLDQRLANTGDVIASFLYGETRGSPLFLQTLLTTLLKERVVAFDYDSLEWRFDLVALQSHLSDASFDAYLENMMRRQPREVQELLKVMAVLPPAGFPLKLLAGLTNTSLGEAENLVQLCINCGILALRNNIVVFTHDRQRVAAHSLIPKVEFCHIHQRIFTFLCHPSLQGDYLFEALNHALIPRKLGTEVADVDNLVCLLLDAIERASLTGNFSVAKALITSTQEIIEDTGGLEGWTERARPLCFRYVRLYMDVASVFHEHDAAFAKLALIRPLCRTPTEKVVTATLLIRQMVAANEHSMAVEHLFATLDEFGYNPEWPKAVDLWFPKNAREIEALGAQMLNSEPATDDNEHVLIMSMISYVGPTIYVTQPKLRAAVFNLGLSVAKALGKLHRSASYIFAIQFVTIHDVDTQLALIALSKQICERYPSSLFTSSALVAVAAQSAFLQPREAVVAATDDAFKTSVAMADYEVASYVISIGLEAQLVAAGVPLWEQLARRYEMVKLYSTNSHRILTNVLLQGWENLARAKGPHPWELNGPFFTETDMEPVQVMRFHPGVCDTIKLRVQFFYDAPAEVMLETLRSCRQTCSSTIGIPTSIEMQWLMAMVQIRTGCGTDLIASCRKFLAPCIAYSPDLCARWAMLTAMELAHADVLGNLVALEKQIDTLDARNHHLLSGYLNFVVGDMLIKKTGSTRLGAGFIMAAFNGFRLAEAVGVCQMLATRFPSHVSADILPKHAPSDFFQDPGFPTLPQRSPSADTTPSMSSQVDRSERMTAMTTTTSEPQSDTLGGSGDSLDTLALMRSSLALAQEKDSLALLCTLLRILCQFSRCEYGAIALSCEDNGSTFRLKAAGLFQRIALHDINLTDEAASQLCPATIMLHVARTGVPIRKPVTTPRLRNDPFFKDRQARTLICLPIHHQGEAAGVIVLLSINSASSAIQSESATEVVTTLATFATIIHAHHLSTRHLRTEVVQRTRELTAALQAKTQFLSQCSHELRSPLAAIMGLAAVLDASPGLTSIQREHLQTISNSGEDLLALISNILDHSKLESNSVLLENIPFSVRQVVEGALDTIAPVAQSKNVELTAVSMFKNEIPGLMGDPFRVKQVLLNLMSNAVKFTPPKDPNSGKSARVTVERSWEQIDDNKIKVTLSVEDTGVGIPQSKLAKLFKSFSQVDESITRSYGGSGLGLVISRDLSRLLGGDCTVESEFGKGSKFKFTFVSQRDPSWKPVPLRRFDTTRSVFILTAPNMLWGRVLEDDLRGFNCSAVLYTGDVDAGLKKETAGGLATGVHFDFLLLDASLITRNHLATIRRLQPNATCIFVTRVTEIAPVMDRLKIARESIISRPLKFQSLQDCLVPVPSGPTRKSGPSSRRSIDKTLGKEKPLQILVVDDSAVNIAVCTRILELYGYSGIDSALNGMQATEMAEKKRYDIIFLDLQMPVLDGFGALKRIRSSPLAGEPCCVSLSANVDKSRCYEAGFWAVLYKPVNIPDLGQILSNAYQYRQGLRESMATASSPSTSVAASTLSRSSPPAVPGVGAAATVSPLPTLTDSPESTPVSLPDIPPTPSAAVEPVPATPLLSASAFARHSSDRSTTSAGSAPPTTPRHTPHTPPASSVFAKPSLFPLQDKEPAAGGVGPVLAPLSTVPTNNPAD